MEEQGAWEAETSREELGHFSYIAAADIAIADTGNLDNLRSQECRDEGLFISTNSRILQRNAPEGAVAEVDMERVIPPLNFGCEALLFQGLLRKSDTLAQVTRGRIHLIALGGRNRQTLEQIMGKVLLHMGADIFLR